MCTKIVNDTHIPEMTAERRGVDKCRKFMRLGNDTGIEIGCHNASYLNLKRGIEERILRTSSGGKLLPVLKPSPNFYTSKLMSKISSAVVRGVNRQPVVPLDKFPGLYKGPKKIIYSRAVESLRIKPLGVRDSDVRAFVKAEKMVLNWKKDPIPRIIQPQDPRYNVGVGVYLKPHEHHIMKSLNALFGQETVVCGQTSDQVAKLIQTKFDSIEDCVVVGMDASKFDQHVSYDALKFEHKIYNDIIKSVTLKRLLRFQLNIKGKAAGRHKIRYRLRGTRVSGAVNTSMGNKIIMCTLTFAFMSRLNIKYHVLNNGDDCLIFVSKKHLHLLNDIEDFFKQAGFKLVLEKPVDVLEKVEFCQMNPIYDGTKWRMVRNSRTSMAKDLTCLRYGHDVNSFKCWLHSVGECGLAMAGNIPVLGSFYNQLVQFGVKNDKIKVDGGLAHWFAGKKGNYIEPSPEARLSYYKCTGITPDEQRVLEKPIPFSLLPSDNAPTLLRAFYK